MGVLGELIVHPRARGRRHRPGADGHRRGDPLVPRRPVRVRPDADPAGAVRRRAAGPRDLRRRGRHPCRCRPRAIRDFWRAMYRPANTVVAVAGDLEHDEAVELAAAAFGTGNGVLPGFEPAPALPAGPRVLTGQARHGPGPARDRGARAPPRPPRRLDAVRAQRRARRRDVEPAVPRRARGEGPRLRRELGHRRVRGLRRARDLRGRRPRPAAGGDRGDPRGGRRGWSTSPSPTRSWRRPRRTSRAASSCAWTTRATSRRGSAARRRSTTACTRSTRRSSPSRRSGSADVTRLAAELFTRRGAADGGRGPGAPPARPRTAPAAAPMTECPARSRPRPRRAAGRPSLRLARVHLRLGSLAARARRARGAVGARDCLDDDGLLDLAEARWRTGDLAGGRRGRDRAGRPRPRRHRRARDRRRGASPPQGRPTRGATACGPGARGDRRAARRRCSPACRAARSGRARTPDGRRRRDRRRRDRCRRRRPSPAAASRPIAGGQAALAAGDSTQAALRLGVAMRLEPGFAEAVLDAVGPRRRRARARARRRRRAPAAGPRDRGAGGVRRRARRGLGRPPAAMPAPGDRRGTTADGRRDGDAGTTTP